MNADEKQKKEFNQIANKIIAQIFPFRFAATLCTSALAFRFPVCYLILLK